MAAPATLLAGIVLDLLPLPLVQVGGLHGPSFTFCMVAAWALRDGGERLRPSVVFAAGLFLDMVSGMPLGFSPLLLLLAHAILERVRRPLRGQPFAALWAVAALAALAAGVLRWLLAVLWWRYPLVPGPMLAEAALTALAFPLVGWPISRQRPERAYAG